MIRSEMNTSSQKKCSSGSKYIMDTIELVQASDEMRTKKTFIEEK